MISNKTQVQDLVQLLVMHDVKRVVISPGSRNAPISVSCIHHPKLDTYTVVDERAAGYVALGMAQQSGNPVAIICTSGSASINYGPAITEAYYQGIPLIAITADRPKEFVNQGDGQTIMQSGLFGSHVKHEIELVDDFGQEDLIWFNQRQINEALIASKSETPGPIHVNVPLRENLYQFDNLSSHSTRFIEAVPRSSKLDSQSASVLQDEVASTKKIMLVTGLLHPDPACTNLIDSILSGGKVVHLAESTSNRVTDSSITTIDRLIMSFNNGETDEFLPDLLITVGGNIVSKKIKALLRQHSGLKHWHIDETGRILDTFQSLSRTISVDERAFLEWLDKQQLTGEYGQLWNERKQKNQLGHGAFVDQLPWSDFKAFDHITHALPADSHVQMGNSSVVRYFQLFDSRDDLAYFSNRGTSGIDGSTSTAVGAALESQVMTTLVTGDLSFSYDSNGLWHQYRPSNLRIIVINNGGGNIFKIIEGPSKTNAMAEAFEAPAAQDFSKLAAFHSIDHQKASNSNELAAGLEWLYTGSDIKILEVDTTQVENALRVKEYFQFLRN